MHKRLDLDAKYLRSCLTYDPDTGVFVWCRRPRATFKNDQAHLAWNVKHAGTEAGSITKMGYRRISIGKRFYMAHRLAWLYMTGRWPAEQVDHVNGDKADNRWANLREALHSENLWNVGKRRDNTSGVKGVSWSRASSKWMAYIAANGTNHYLGLFTDINEAAAAYADAAKRLHKDFGRVK